VSIAVDLAIVVIGGLIGSTLLTLAVIPVIYSLIEALRTRLVGQTQT
jgi:multidrug efflux pump subunit AcrB